MNHLLSSANRISINGRPFNPKFSKTRSSSILNGKTLKLERNFSSFFSPTFPFNHLNLSKISLVSSLYSSLHSTTTTSSPFSLPLTNNINKRNFSNSFKRSAEEEKKKSKEEKKEENSISKSKKNRKAEEDPGNGDDESLFGRLARFPWVFFALNMVAFFYITSIIINSDKNSAKQTDWYTFKNQILNSGLVERLEVDPASKKVYVFLKDMKTASYTFTIGNVELFEKQLRKTHNELGISILDSVPVNYQHPGLLSKLAGVALGVAPTALLIGLLVYVTRGFHKANKKDGGLLSGLTKSKLKKFNKEKSVKVKFSEVAGMDETKREVMEFVDFLKRPERYNKLGAKLPKGAILVGPPGTGKTLLAKAAAGEANVPFFSCAGSDFIEMFGGMGSSRVRSMFKEARESAPCIVFIDEIDAIGRARGSGFRSDERDNTLNALLVEMDGFDSKSGVIVLAGTNRVDILDKALLRPGRFDRQISIDLPDIKGRNEIFKVHLKKLTLEEEPIDKYSEKMATFTPGFSGAEIANVCNEGALFAARRNQSKVTMKDLQDAVERVIGGMERENRIMSPEEKIVVAYHEAGHAVTGWFLEHVDPLMKVSIVPRGVAALGYAQYQPKDQELHSKEEIFDRICMTLGGRVAEIVKFGKITTGASDDLDKVTKMAYSEVAQYGMSPEIGTVSYKIDSHHFEKQYSEATAKIIDLEVKKLVKEAFDYTTNLLGDQKENLEKVAQLLLQREVINREDLVELLGPRPWGDTAVTYEQLTYQQQGKKVEEQKKEVEEQKNEEKTADEVDKKQEEKKTERKKREPKKEK
eukprot:TRINITY_DN4837_c0_g1_i1.p1 TRINITY_DN4837_c0_g1~~TRINITY_DN4837_c0_g1_i1.p1  ORF type:complete len:811 (+),score=243.44 TRINITY_DN4837_c0_g1_i1:139-2571(+)